MFGVGPFVAHRDGGVLFLTDPSGCILFEATIEATPATAAAAISSADFLFSVGADGACQSIDDRGDLDLSQANAGDMDFGTCPVSYSSLTACTQAPPSSAYGALNAPLSTAFEATCAAVCASAACREFAMGIAGPVPPGLGCCQQARPALAWTRRPAAGSPCASVPLRPRRTGQPANSPPRP